jgi:hypothetical protein
MFQFEGVLMANFSKLVLFAVFVLVSGASVADDQTPSPPLSAAEQAQLKAQRDAAKAARAKLTPEEKRAAAAKKGAIAGGGDSDIRALDPTPEQAAKLKADAAAAKAARARATAADKDANRAKKQQQLQGAERSGPGS